MGKKSSSPPPEPDPVATAKAQADANRITQLTPSGNMYYGTVDANGNFNRNNNQDAVQVQESDFGKNLRENGEELALSLAGQIDPNNLPNIDLGNLPAMRSSGDINNNIGSVDDVRNATFNSMVNQLNPQFDQQERKLEQRMADQGLAMGDEAYTTQFDNFNRNRNNAYNDASLQSVLAGSDEYNRMLGNQLQLGGYESGQRSQQLGEMASTRGQGFNEVASIFGLQPLPQFQNVPQVDVAGITNSAYNNQLNNYGLKQQNRANNLGFVGDLASAGAMAYAFSDKRLKTNIEKVGEKNGFNIYEFDYKIGNGRYRGVMADEVEKIQPDAVTEDTYGYKMVNYNKIGIDFELIA